MAGSQLKRLKASLREQGITGPQQSKKQRRRAAQDTQARNEKRLQRGVVLDGIREQFNPFDLKHAVRGPKFDVTTNRPPPTPGIKGRPGQAKAVGEERRRETLLVDMQRRNKVGGILDRRFGENDPTMAPEDKMLERFAREKQRSHKKSSMFDLEGDEDEPMEGLTHMGRTIAFDDEAPRDDFQEDDLDFDSDSDVSEREQQRRKRMRAMDGIVDEEADERPERKKTKKEVMEEIIAKSKYHRMEKQAAKEEDTDLREELDKELSSIQNLLWTGRNTATRRDGEVASSHTIAGVDRDAFERDFDLQVKRLAQDRRAQPADRTKTEEEKVEEESKRLKELEDKRQRRMRGEEVTDSEEESEDGKGVTGEPDAIDATDDEEDQFGLGEGIKARPTATELGFDDEDDFIIDDDLVADASDVDSITSEPDSDEQEDEGQDDEEDDEFTKGLLNEEEARNPVFEVDSSARTAAIEQGDEKGLPFTFPCPQSVEEFVAVTAAYPHKHLPTIVQRIRALYHPKLDSRNKERLANFSAALLDFVASPWDPATSPPFSILESIVRHIHSMAKMFPIETALRFRYHLEEIGESRPLALEPADLILLTAAGTIFPTSDHFHQVATPAILTMARYLGQKVPHDLTEYTTGIYLSILSLQYQQLSKRFVPEVINFTLNTICALAPVAPSGQLGNFPVHKPRAGTRIEWAQGIAPRRLMFADLLQADRETAQTASLQVAALEASLQVLNSATDTWTGKSSFIETFSQGSNVLKHLLSPSCRKHLPSGIKDGAEKLQAKLDRMLRVAQIARRPLELHHHRPLAIKTYIPKFEETFDPNKHYDPDRERAELAKLKKEHRKERKGAMRELRKDANFMARENLRVKKAKDEAYEKKYKRIVAEIQSEEGRESNMYEREKKARKRDRDKDKDK